MTPQESRTISAREELAFALIEKHPNLKKEPIRRLLDVSVECIAWREHIETGAPLALDEITEFAESSDIGGFIFAARSVEETEVDPIRATQGMNNQQRINWARNNGYD